MLWIKSGIENPSKSEVIGRCGRDEKTEWPHGTDKKVKSFFWSYSFILPVSFYNLLQNVSSNNL